MDIKSTNKEYTHKPVSAFGMFNKAKLTTKELAEVLNFQQQTLRASLCRYGHYLGLRPTKLPNGRWLWDADAVARLMKGEPA